MASTKKHNLLDNTSANRDLHTSGYVVANYTALLALSGMQDNDLAFFYMGGNKVTWIFDQALNSGGGLWRTISPFYSLNANIGSLAGMQIGDALVVTDNKRYAIWLGAWSYLV